MRLRFTLLLLTAGCVLSATVSGDAYRWVDENGVTVFSQTPPPETEAARIKTAPDDPRRSEAAWKALEERQQALQDRQNAATEKKAALEGEHKTAADRQANCRSAKNNLQILAGPSQKQIRLPDGGYQRLTPKERQKRIDEHSGKSNKTVTENATTQDPDQHRDDTGPVHGCPAACVQRTGQAAG